MMRIALPRTARVLGYAGLFALAALLGLSIHATAEAQVVQQPQFNFFSTQSSVLVPDRGGTSMGGLGRAASGSTTRGVPVLGRVPGLNRGFQNRSLGRSVSGGGVSVHATIIDLAEMDRAILEAASQGRATTSETVEMNQHAGVLSQQVQGAAGGEDMPLQSVAEIRRQQQAADAFQSEAALSRYADAQAAEAEGNYGLARIHYRMALRDASGEMAAEIAARLAALDNARRSMAER